MISDETHPEMRAAMAELKQHVAMVLGMDMSKYSLQALRDMLDSHRARWRMRGVDFPALVALVVPRAGFIKLVRADLDRASIEQNVVNMARAGVSMPDIINAVRAAFPDFKQEPGRW